GQVRKEAAPTSSGTGHRAGLPPHPHHARIFSGAEFPFPSDADRFVRAESRNGEGSMAEGDNISGTDSQKTGYRVLARKYRPKDFSDLMVGQEAMVKTLTNAFESGRIAQAYMLTGVRGVGKTTTARILARAL